MSDRVIEQADLRTIEHNLVAIHNDLQTLDSNVGAVNSNIKVVYDEIGSLAKEFHDFVSVQQRANRLNQAETRLVKIRQELEKKYGHYDIVRRTTTGILQADDIGIDDFHSRLLACTLSCCTCGMDQRSAGTCRESH